jgi:hypothetical protein
MVVNMGRKKKKKDECEAASNVDFSTVNGKPVVNPLDWYRDELFERAERSSSALLSILKELKDDETQAWACAKLLEYYKKRKDAALRIIAMMANERFVIWAFNVALELGDTNLIDYIFHTYRKRFKRKMQKIPLPPTKGQKEILEEIRKLEKEGFL